MLKCVAYHRNVAEDKATNIFKDSFNPNHDDKNHKG